MATTTIQDLVNSLTPPEQDAVRAFVKYLRDREQAGASTQQVSFLSAARQFMDEHPEILKRLGQ